MKDLWQFCSAIVTQMCFHLGKFKQEKVKFRFFFVNCQIETINYFLVFFIVVVIGMRTSKSWTTFQQSVFILQTLTGEFALS